MENDRGAGRVTSLWMTRRAGFRSRGNQENIKKYLFKEEKKCMKNERWYIALPRYWKEKKILRENKMYEKGEKLWLWMTCRAVLGRGNQENIIYWEKKKCIKEKWKATHRASGLKETKKCLLKEEKEMYAERKITELCCRGKQENIYWRKKEMNAERKMKRRAFHLEITKIFFERRKVYEKGEKLSLRMTLWLMWI